MSNNLHDFPRKKSLKMFDSPSQKKEQIKSQIRVMMVGKGHLHGLEDAVNDRYHTTSFRCWSNVGSLYRIRTVEFLELVAQNAAVSELFLNYTDNRDSYMVKQIRGQRIAINKMSTCITSSNSASNSREELLFLTGMYGKQRPRDLSSVDII